MERKRIQIYVKWRSKIEKKKLRTNARNEGKERKECTKYKEEEI